MLSRTDFREASGVLAGNWLVSYWWNTLKMYVFFCSWCGFFLVFVPAILYTISCFTLLYLLRHHNKNFKLFCWMDFVLPLFPLKIQGRHAFRRHERLCNVHKTRQPFVESSLKTLLWVFEKVYHSIFPLEPGYVIVLDYKFHSFFGDSGSFKKPHSQALFLVVTLLYLGAV